jgi:hypothetical protein
MSVTNALDPTKNGVENALDPTKNGVENALDPTKNGVENALDPTTNGLTKEIKSKSDTSKIILSVVYAFIISILTLILITNNMVPLPLIISIIPAIAYGISLGLSSLYQYSMCNKLSIGHIAVSNMFIVITTFIATTILYVEQLPILKYIFGEYKNTVELTGSECCDKNLLKDPEAHYKIQFFTKIVKAVLPRFLTGENLKLGFVYFYWLFWMTILPFFFLLSLQGICK